MRDYKKTAYSPAYYDKRREENEIFISKELEVQSEFVALGNERFCGAMRSRARIGACFSGLENLFARRDNALLRIFNDSERRRYGAVLYTLRRAVFYNRTADV